MRVAQGQKISRGSLRVWETFSKQNYQIKLSMEMSTGHPRPASPVFAIHADNACKYRQTSSHRIQKKPRVSFLAGGIFPPTSFAAPSAKGDAFDEAPVAPADNRLPGLFVLLRAGFSSGPRAELVGFRFKAFSAQV